MSSSIGSSTSSPSSSCEERTAELIRKIKEISSRTPNPTPSSPDKTKVKSPPRSKSAPPTRPSSSSSPKPLTPSPSPAPLIDVIFPSATPKCSASPAPKALKSSFPCPPLISLATESKISPRGDSSNGPSGRKGRGRYRRPRGTLYTPPKLGSQKPRTSNTPVNKNPSNFPKLTLLTSRKLEIEKAMSEERVPERLTKLPEVEPFRMESALEHRVTYSEDPRLEDPFKRVEYAQLYWETVRRAAFEVDWQGLGVWWWD